MYQVKMVTKERTVTVSEFESLEGAKARIAFLILAYIERNSPCLLYPYRGPEGNGFTAVAEKKVVHYVIKEDKVWWKEHNDNSR